MTPINIYFNDLNERAKKKLLDLFGVSDPKEMNWDIDFVPLATLDFEEWDYVYKPTFNEEVHK